jgi:hypothetical protein
VDWPMTGLAPMQLFRDVPVVPVRTIRRLKGRGGPIWPDFETQVAARHCRDGIPSDSLPPPPARMRPLRRPAVWGGLLATQFGHLVGEHLTRLPQSLRDRPDDLYLFTCMPGATPETLPGYIWDVLNWYGVVRDRVRLVLQPVMARELRVAGQGEMLGRVATSAEYLDILEATSRRNGLVPETNRHVFVTRAGMVPAGKGGHAGESYLAGVLDRLGVRVIEPGAVSIHRQMELYAGADTLIFAEGSALHGRCLLGRVAQDIHVLMRRPSRRTAEVQLRARCRRLSYHPVLAGRLGTRTEVRGSRKDLELALFDPEVLIPVFQDIGIDLRPHWDTEAYLAAVRSDVSAWMTKAPTSADQQAENLAVLADLDVIPDPLPELPATPPAFDPT